MTDGVKQAVNPWTILGWIFDALGAAALAFCVWMASEIADLKEWRAETAGNRWNSQMQADYATKQAAELTKIWQEMASMKADWIKSIGDLNLKLAQLPITLEYVRDNLRGHDARLNALENRKTGGSQ